MLEMASTVIELYMSEPEAEKKTVLSSHFIDIKLKKLLLIHVCNDLLAAILTTIHLVSL